jgi:predicted secreted protein
MIKDRRSRKVVFVSHCIINTNAIAIGPKTPNIWPAMIDEIVDCLKKNKVSIIQLPCPEQIYYGLIRGIATKNDMDNPGFRKLCRKIAEEAINNMEQYIKNNFRVVAFIGRRGSPTCGVKKTHVRKNDEIIEENGMGILVEEICKIIKDKRIEIPLIDFEREEKVQFIKQLEKLIK